MGLLIEKESSLFGFMFYVFIPRLGHLDPSHRQAQGSRGESQVLYYFSQPLKQAESQGQITLPTHTVAKYKTID